MSPGRELRRSILVALATMPIDPETSRGTLLRSVASRATEAVTEDMRGEDWERRKNARERGEDVQPVDPTDLAMLGQVAGAGPWRGQELADLEPQYGEVLDELIKAADLTLGQAEVIALDRAGFKTKEEALILDTSEDAIRRRRSDAYRRLREAAGVA